MMRKMVTNSRQPYCRQFVNKKLSIDKPKNIRVKLESHRAQQYCQTPFVHIILSIFTCCCQSYSLKTKNSLNLIVFALLIASKSCEDDFYSHLFPLMQKWLIIRLTHHSGNVTGLICSIWEKIKRLLSIVAAADEIILLMKWMHESSTIYIAQLSSQSQSPN